jgi:hypothetical protein
MNKLHFKLSLRISPWALEMIKSSEKGTSDQSDLLLLLHILHIAHCINDS